MQIICRLFGSPAIFIEDRQIQFPYKKAEALFYYLLTVSSASRQELSSLLWPELSEVSAKKNLRNAIYKIKEAFEGEEIIKTEKSSVSINRDIAIIYRGQYPSQRISLNKKISSGPKTPLDENISSKENSFSIEDISSEEFLKDFSVKNSASFDQWLDSKREYYRQLYIDVLHDEIDKHEANKDWKMMQLCSRKLTQIDEFDEKGYAGLIRSYHRQRAYDKAISAYKHLEKLLQNELGIKPAAYIKDIFNELLDDMNSYYNKGDISDDKLFFDRYSELRAIEKAWERFKASGDSNAVIVSGERGSGKTALIEEFLSSVKESIMGSIQNDSAEHEKPDNINENNESEIYQEKENNNAVYLMELKCMKEESNQPFRAWKTLIMQRYQQKNNFEIQDLSKDGKYIDGKENEDLPKELISLMKTRLGIRADDEKQTEDFERAEEIERMRDMITDIVVSYLFEEHSSYLFIVDDLHNMDTESMALLDSILANLKGIMLVASCDIRGMANVRRLLSRENKISFIDIKRWTKSDLLQIIKESLDEKQQALTDEEHMLYHTQGVAMFVYDYIMQIRRGNDPEILTDKVKLRLDLLLSDLSNDERLLLETASYFSDDADIGLLKELTGVDEQRLSYALDSLCKRQLLQECEYSFNDRENTYKINTYDSLIYVCDHPAIKEHIYSSQSMTIRRMNHQKIADMLEHRILQMNSDMALYHRMIHHYMKAGNKSRALEFSVKSLNRYLNYSHELFPILFAEDQALIGSGYMNKLSMLSYLDDIESLLKDVKKEGLTREYQISEIAFFHLKGRYLIREAEYEEGTMLIRKMIEKSLDIEDDDYALEGYKQMIYYCIQTGDADLMQRNIRLALDIAIKHNYHKETGIIMRFNGLYHMLKGEYEKAWQLLQSSVGTFTISDEVADKYALNIAAAYNYMGEIRRLEGQYENAAQYYQKAIDIGISKDAVTSLMVFYINAGQNEYQKGDHEAAKEYFKKAEVCQGRADIHWKKSILSAYTGLLEIEEISREDNVRDKKASEKNSDEDHTDLNSESNSVESINRIKRYENAIEKIKKANEQAGKMKNPSEIRTAQWALEQAEEILRRLRMTGI